jgi:hypothetical protein
MTMETMIEPLLLGRDNTKAIRDMNVLKRSSMIFGFFFGIFIQFSTLGANWVIITILGPDSFANATQLQLFMCSLIWSAMSSILTVYLVKLLRDSMRVVQTMEHHVNKDNSTKRKHSIPMSSTRLDILMAFTYAYDLFNSCIVLCFR